MPPTPDAHPAAMLTGKQVSSAIVSNAERRAVETLPARIHPRDALRDIVRAGERQVFSFHGARDVPDLQGLHGPDLDRKRLARAVRVAGSARTACSDGPIFRFQYNTHSDW